MSMAYGFYYGIFYPPCSPVFDFEDDNPKKDGPCFATIGKPTDYHGFLLQTAELRSDYILYA